MQNIRTLLPHWRASKLAISGENPIVLAANVVNVNIANESFTLAASTPVAGADVNP